MVVDADSTDNSLQQIKTFPFRKGIDVEIIEARKRVTVYEAWNMAIDASNTPYCMNVNTDDRLYPAALQTVMSYSRVEPDIDVFYPRFFVVQDPDHSRVVNYFDGPEFTLSVLRQGCYMGPFPLLKRQSLLDAGLFDQSYRFAGDYEMWLRMATKGYKFRKVREAIGSYYINPVGISSDNKTKTERLREVGKIQELYQA